MRRWDSTVGETRAALGPAPWVAWVAPVGAFIRKRPLGAVGGVILVVMVLAAVFAPVVASQDPLQDNIPQRLHAPSRAHLFGTDDLGRDMFSRVVYGARVSIFVGLLSVLGGTTFGTLLGITSAYVRGWFDLLVQRLVDALQGIPSLVLVMALVLVLGPSLVNVTIAIGIGFLARMIRIARGQALGLQEQDFVTAARAMGASQIRIVLRHITPNALTPSIVVGTALLGAAIVTEASLSFLGLGVPPPHPSWGRMLQFAAKGYMELAPWLAIFPGVALAVVVFGFNLFGDALRDSLDPRLRGGG